MNKYLVFLGFFIFPLTVKAELSIGQERDMCFKNNKDIPSSYNCLSSKRQISNDKLDALISETVRRIKENNVGPFNGKEGSKETAGDVYSKRFLQAQKDWKSYRSKLCLSIATELDEDSDDYQSYIDQCQINLNKNHTNEILQMGLPSDQ